MPGCGRFGPDLGAGCGDFGVRQATVDGRQRQVSAALRAPNPGNPPNGNLGDTALTGQAIHAAYRRAAQAGGLSPAKIAQLGGHSVRAGFVTEALRNGAQPHEIQRQTGHASPRSTPASTTR